MSECAGHFSSSFGTLSIARALTHRVHHNQLVNASAAAPFLEDLRHTTRSRIGELKDIIGFNRAGLLAVQQEMALAGKAP